MTQSTVGQPPKKGMTPHPQKAAPDSSHAGVARLVLQRGDLAPQVFVPPLASPQFPAQLLPRPQYRPPLPCQPQ
jgi:hypothetical protein